MLKTARTAQNARDQAQVCTNAPRSSLEFVVKPANTLTQRMCPYPNLCQRLYNGLELFTFRESENCIPSWEKWKEVSQFSLGKMSEGLPRQFCEILFNKNASLSLSLSLPLLKFIPSPFSKALTWVFLGPVHNHTFSFIIFHSILL